MEEKKEKSNQKGIAENIIFVVMIVVMAIVVIANLFLFLSQHKGGVELEKNTDNSKEYAIITKKNRLGMEQWKKQTSSYEKSNVENIVEIGQNNGAYYYVEGGTVVKLDLKTGEELWRCDDVNVGSPKEEAVAISEDGTVYVSGYLGPDFVAIREDRTMLYKIDTFAEGYSSDYLPYKIDLNASYVDIYIEGDFFDEEQNVAVNVVVRLDLDTFSCCVMTIKKEETGNNVDSYLLSEESTEESTEEQEKADKAEGDNETAAKATTAKQEATLEGVDSSNTPDYEKCTDPSDYIRVDWKDNFGFSYPRDFFRTVEIDDDNYIFKTKNGTVTMHMKHEKGSGDKEKDIKNSYQFLKGKLDEKDDETFLSRIADKETDGWLRCCYSGLYLDDSNKSVYFIAVSNGKDIYTMDFEYYEPDESLYTPQNYMIDCLYRLFDYSGTEYAVRTYNQFLADDMGSKNGKNVVKR